MASYSNTLRSKMYSGSPHSSSGSGSFDGTPESKLTIFSPPEDRDTTDRDPVGMKSFASSQKTARALVAADQHDPFISSTTPSKPREVKRLSATAPTFQLSVKPQAGAATPSRVRIPSQAPGIFEHLQKETLDEREISSFGTFTTDTNTSRCMKISSLYGADAEQMVNASLSNLLESGWKRKGADHCVVVLDSTTVFIREAHLTDAAKVYTTLKIDSLEHLEVFYVSPTVYGQALSPPSAISAHEGQVYLEVSYPSDPNIHRVQFEQGLVNLVAVEGPLCAWQKLHTSTPGTFLLLAEFYDASCAPRAVARLNHMQISTSDNVFMIAKEHSPDDLTLPKIKATPTQTPTRQFTDRMGRLSDDFGNMLIRQTSESDGRPNIPMVYGLTMPPAMAPAPISRPNPYGHMMNRTPGSIERSNVYTASVALQRTPGSSNRSAGFGAQAGSTHTPGSIDRSNPFVSPAMGNGTSYLPANNSFSLPPGSMGLPMMLGGIPMQQSMMTPTGLSQTALQAMSQHMYASPPLYQYPGLEPSSMSPVGFQQHSMGMPYSPTTPVSSRDLISFGRSGSLSAGRRSSAIKVPSHGRRQHPNPAAGQHNHVDCARIQDGMDVRTTVMLRNIPNKVDQSMLKAIVDESSFGRYDFMYLRIDFSNNCNVGYAFINFVDPLDIVQFVTARSNQKWHRFKSDKVAEVSYATIQGRDCLIQKFRNSSVMLEPAHYRPKLFFTLNDQFGRAGEEDQFPGSDNASKLKRSCENAEHVGLFAPSAGQHLRDEQRRRRSQYDRGTSLAEQEEFDYEDFGSYEAAPPAFFNPYSY